MVQAPPLASFGEGQDAAFATYQELSQNNNKKGAAEALEHWQAINWPIRTLVDIGEAPLDTLSPQCLNGQYGSLIASIDNGPDAVGPIKYGYAALGLVFLLGKSREAYAHFAQTEEAEKVDDFDLVTFREQLEASSPTEDITKPDDVRDQTLKAWANDPFRLFGKELATRDNRDYLQLIGTIKMTLQRATLAPFMEDLRRIDTRYTPPAFIVYVKDVLAKEYPKAGPSGRPTRGI